MTGYMLIALLYIASIVGIANGIIVLLMSLRDSAVVSDGWKTVSKFWFVFGVVMWVLPRTVSVQDRIYLNETIAAPQIYVDREWHMLNEYGTAIFVGIAIAAAFVGALMMYSHQQGLKEMKKKLDEKDAYIADQNKLLAPAASSAANDMIKAVIAANSPATAPPTPPTPPTTT